MRASPAPPPPNRPGPRADLMADGHAPTAFLASVRAHPLLVALVALVTLLAGVAWSATRGQTYEASAQILLTPLPETGRSLPRLPLLRVSSDRTRLAQTAASLLESPAAAEATARAMGAGWTPERVRAAVDVQPEGESDVISVTASTADPVLTERLANRYARAALEARGDAVRPIVSSSIAETQRELRAETDASSPVALDLAERLADLRAIGTSGDPTFSLTRAAIAPTAPSGPPRWLLAVLSLLAGIAVGLGCALLLDLLGPARVVDAAHAVGLTGLPVLARVPGLAPWRRTRPSPVAFRPAAATALRVLQHQLDVHPQSGRRVLFTGVSAGDGVTTSVAELGLTLAHAGYEVLLVDTDTLDPELAARLGTAPPRPLADALAARDGWQACVVPVPRARGLHLLAVGAQGSMGIPDELAAELPRIFADARATYDYVLVDAPPPAASGEALQVAAAVETSVLVLRPGKTRLADLEVALGMLSRAGRWPEGLLIVGGRAPVPPAAQRPAGRVAESAPGPAPVTRAAGA